MARVKALTPYTVSSGAKVRLSEAQRKVRAHVPADESEDGWLIFGGALTFKAGEVFELENVPKGAALSILADAEPLITNNHSEATATTSAEHPEAALSVANTEENSSGGDADSAVKGETANAETKEPEGGHSSELSGKAPNEVQSKASAEPTKPAKKAKP